jgi:Ca2+-binding EF-hand superfamily protein
MVLLEKNIKLESTFSIFDVNNEEIIDKKQFIAGLKSIGLYSKMYPIEIDALFGKFDTNGSECVTEHEFYFFIKSCNMSEILKQIKRNKA